jgi:ribonuclease BN (tRNA processing enzyme)
MKLTILGSGTAAPRLKRNSASYLLKIEDKKLLFDSGPGTIRQLLKLKVNLLDIDDIFYTHFHNDHISDLPAIIWSNNYGTYRKRPLNIYGPKGFKEYFKILMTKILRPKELIYKINIRELRNNSTLMIQSNKNNLIRIKIKKVKHNRESIAYRIEYKNKVLVYSGDLGYCSSIIELAKNADLLILECAFPNNMPKPEHLSPSLCGEIATKVDAKKLILTHLYPECDKVDILKQCRKTFNGEIIKAKDFLSINL